MLVSYWGHSQKPFSNYEHLFTTPENYTAQFTAIPPLMDGNINDQAWQSAAWSKNFRDIEGDKKPLPPLQTRMKMLWNDTCLFIAAELIEPHVWATLREHDEIIFHDNDFEVFIDPDNNTHHYYEIEVNALNTIFDLFMPKPYRNQSGAMINWDLTRLQSAVQIRGTLNKSSDTDSSWTVEMAIPFQSVFTGNKSKPPLEGEIWRINFSRVEWDAEIVNGKYVKIKDATGKFRPEHNWVWSPQGVVNMHFPERWGYLQFTRNSGQPAPFKMPYEEKQKDPLWLCYYRQKEYSGKNKRYASSLKEIGMDTSHIMIDGIPNTLTMEATSKQFTATITDQQNNAVSINDEGLIRYVKNAGNK
jgi:hypothetical protein